MNILFVVVALTLISYFFSGVLLKTYSKNQLYKVLLDNEKKDILIKDSLIFRIVFNYYIISFVALIATYDTVFTQKTYFILSSINILILAYTISLILIYKNKNTILYNELASYDNSKSLSKSFHETNEFFKKNYVDSDLISSLEKKKICCCTCIKMFCTGNTMVERIKELEILKLFNSLDSDINLPSVYHLIDHDIEYFDDTEFDLINLG